MYLIIRAQVGGSASAAAGWRITSGLSLRLARLARNLRTSAPAESVAPVAERGRQSEGVGGDVARRHVGEDELVLIDIADGARPGQHRRVETPRNLQKRVGGKRAGAPCRQKYGHVAKSSGPGVKPATQPQAVAQVRVSSVGRNGATAEMVNTRDAAGGAPAFSPPGEAKGGDNCIVDPRVRTLNGRTIHGLPPPYFPGSGSGRPEIKLSVSGEPIPDFADAPSGLQEEECREGQLIPPSDFITRRWQRSQLPAAAIASGVRHASTRFQPQA